MPKSIPVPEMTPQSGAGVIGKLTIGNWNPDLLDNLLKRTIDREIKSRLALKKLLLEEVGLDEKDVEEIIKRVFEQ